MGREIWLFKMYGYMMAYKIAICYGMYFTYLFLEK